MVKLKTISLYDWFLIAPGVFFIGVSVGLVLGSFTFAPWIFALGFLMEIPALLALRKHKADKNTLER